MEYTVKVATSGAPTAANLSITLLETIDTGKLTNTAGAEQPVGTFIVADSATTYYTGLVTYASSTTVAAYVQGVAGTYANLASVSSTVPMSFGASDSVNLIFKVPISGWNG